MPEIVETLEQSADEAARGGAGRPGVALLFSGGVPTLRVITLGTTPVAIGREPGVGFAVDDRHLSRRHASVARGEDGGWRVSDLESRNGTFIAGRRVTSERLDEGRHLLRVGSSLLALLPDVTDLQHGSVVVEEGHVIGPALAAQLEALRRFSAQNSVVHVRGETGSGKELAARRFHASGKYPTGPFIAVNCGAIPRDLAEALLFGARKGSYTGAVADTEGYVVSADRGTLFLDEVGELAPTTQAKLLRVLETREVVPLGASRGQKVDVRICSATHKDLRLEAAEGRFREDLFFRLGRPLVFIPPLRQRIEEVPFLVRLAVDRVDASLRLDVSFVEACLLRPWPGNVRELLTEAGEAARRATDESSPRLEGRHLDPHAGRALATGSGSASQTAERTLPRPPKATMSMLTIENVTAALKREHGNLSRTARALGVHRTQVKRFIAKHNLSVLGDTSE